ncbi:MAG: hypothetical protein ACYCUV_08415 [Phycisphaerae bacterium]
MKRTQHYTGHRPAIEISLALAATLSFGHICRAVQKSAGGSETKPSLIIAVVHRLERLQNVTVRYQEKKFQSKAVFSMKAFKILDKRYHAVPEFGYRFYTCEFRFLHGRAFYERRLTPISLAAVGKPGGPLPSNDIKSVESFLPSRTETLTYGHYNPRRPVGAIMNPGSRRLPISSLIDVAMGLRRGPASRHWMSVADLRTMSVSNLGSGRAVMREQAANGFLLRWYWDWRSRRIELRELEAVDPRGVIYDRIVCGMFRNVGGLLLPERVVETGWWDSPRYGTKPPLSDRVTLTNLRYRIDPKSNTPESYYIVFPKGSGVLDERINQQFNVESGPRRLTDKAIFKLQEHYDTLPGHAMLPNASTAKPSLNPPALPIASSAAPSTGASRVGMPRWLWEAIAALAIGGLAVVVWLIIKVAREVKR